MKRLPKNLSMDYLICLRLSIFGLFLATVENIFNLMRSDAECLIEIPLFFFNRWLEDV